MTKYICLIILVSCRDSRRGFQVHHWHEKQQNCYKTVNGAYWPKGLTQEHTNCPAVSGCPETASTALNLIKIYFPPAIQMTSLQIPLHLTTLDSTKCCILLRKKTMPRMFNCRTGRQKLQRLKGTCVAYGKFLLLFSFQPCDNPKINQSFE